MNAPFGDFLPLDLCVDALDAYAYVIQQAVGSQTDLSMSVYVASLRSDLKKGRIRHRFWIPTDSMPANVGTKLELDGSIPIGNFNMLRANGYYSITALYKANGKDYQNNEPV